jgi:hypothetical protein
VQIIRRYIYDIPVLDLAGRFVVCADPERTALRRPVAMLVSEGRVNVLLHFGRVTDIDAHGLGELAWSVTTLRRSGGRDGTDWAESVGAPAACPHKTRHDPYHLQYRV